MSNKAKDVKFCKAEHITQTEQLIIFLNNTTEKLFYFLTSIS